MSPLSKFISWIPTLTLFAILAVALLSTPPPTYAKIDCSEMSGAAETSCKAQNACEDKKSEGKVFARAFNNACVTLPEFIETVVNYVMMFASIIAGFMLLQGGLKIIASRGNPTAMVEARSTIINAAVGLILLATSYVIIQFLSDAFGNGITPDINLLGPFTP